MSITNFTRGPWHWRRDANIVDADHNRIQIADLYGTRPGGSGAPSETDRAANGLLIAAAPDLYTVLDAFLSDIDEHGEVGFTLRQRARALLNKIEGLTP